MVTSSPVKPFRPFQLGVERGLLLMYIPLPPSSHPVLGGS